MPQTPRRRLSADERRAQIIAATVEVIDSRGYPAATLTEIAAAAGVAKGLVWHYFDDRDDLMRQTLDALTDRIRHVVVAGLDLTRPAPDILRAVLHGTALLVRSHRADLEAIDQIVHNLRTPDGRQRVTMVDVEPLWAEHELLLQRGVAEGTLRVPDLRAAAVLYQGAIDVMIGYLQAHPDVDAAGYARTTADLLLSGLGAVSARR